jgi:hypothetical protein
MSRRPSAHVRPPRLRARKAPPCPSSSSAAAKDIWAVGDGVIIHYDGNGWTAISVGTNDLRDVIGTSSSDVWAAGYGGILHYNGTSWSVVTSVPSVAVGAAGGKVWAVTWSKYGNSGNSYAVGTLNGATISSEKTFDSTAIRAVRGSGASDAILVGDHGTMLRFDGVSWVRIGVGPDDDTKNPQVYRDVAAISPKDAWMVGESSENYMPNTAAHWDGASITFVQTSVKLRGISAWASSPTDVWIAAGYYGMKHLSSTTWSSVAEWNDMSSPYAVGGTSSSDVWAVGDRCNSGCTKFLCRVSHFNGSSWSDAVTPWSGQSCSSYDQYDAWGRTATDVWIAGGKGLLHWNGSAWSEASTTSTQSVHGSSGTDVWAVTQSGGISHWNGSAWSPSVLPTGVSANAVWAAGPGEAVATARSSDGTLILRFNGTSWTRESVVTKGSAGGHLRGVVVATSPTVWATVNGDVIRYSR